MNDYEQLVWLIKQLTADGHLSPDEVWILADWLNTHQGAREVWPGNLLFRVLRQYFADGEISEPEMAQLARMIASIELEIAKSSSPPIETDSDVKPVPPKILALTVPAFDYAFEVQSLDSGELYEVNLLKQTCSCADWAAKRAKIPHGDPRRICKHLVQAIFQMELQEEINHPVLAVLENCRHRNCGTNPHDTYDLIEACGNPVLLTYHSGEWVNVYARKGGAFDRFGYNIVEKRWSYSEAPPGALAIRRRIHSTIIPVISY